MTWKCGYCGEAQQGPTVICKNAKKFIRNLKIKKKESVKSPWVCAGCGDKAPPSLVCKKCKEKSLADSKKEQSKNRRFNVGDFFLPKVVSIEITEVKHESHLTVYPYTVLVSIRGDEDPSIITKEFCDFSERNFDSHVKSFSFQVPLNKDINMYDYNVERKFIFTEEGQDALQKVRANIEKNIKGSGCIRMAEAIRGLTGDSWSMLACVDFLVEKKEIVEIKQAREPAGQYRIFARPMEY